ncbi:MAG: hypothetical protein ACRDD7_14630, partial [Peptostreptococcaceae bacterium]
IPPNPIGNTMAIGSNGYNGGYYSNIYNNYYNPYLAAQQAQIQQVQLAEQQRMQSDVLKSISRAVNKSIGTDIQDWDKHLSQYDPQDQRMQQQDPEELITQRLLNLNQNGFNGNIFAYQTIVANNAYYDKVKQQYPDDMESLEFSKQFGEIYVEMLQDRQKQLGKNLGQLYDRNGYGQLVQMHKNNNSYFNTVFGNKQPQGNISIDDMEIKLPNHLQNEYQDRKQAFLNSILGK